MEVQGFDVPGVHLQSSCERGYLEVELDIVKDGSYAGSGLTLWVLLMGMVARV